MAANDHLTARPMPYPVFDGSQLCAQTDPVLFFPDETDTPKLTAETARAVCGGCPVLDDCRAYSLSYAVHGIWAGLNERQRQRERSRLQIRALQPDLGALLRDLILAADRRILAVDLAAQLGCSDKTVQRYRRVA